VLHVLTVAIRMRRKSGARNGTSGQKEGSVKVALGTEWMLSAAMRMGRVVFDIYRSFGALSMIGHRIETSRSRYNKIDQEIHTRG